MLTDVTTNSIEDVLPVRAIPSIAAVLSSKADEELKEQVVMILGNIAGDSAKLRDQIIDSGLMNIILNLLNDSANLEMLRNCTWALRNMCSGKNPAPDPILVSQSIPMLAKLINHEDFSVLTDACWALSNMCEGSKVLVQIVVNANVCPRLVELLTFKKSNHVIAGAIQAIGNIVASSEAQSQIIIDCNALPSFCELLCHKKADIIKNTCWTISNIALGHSNQIQSLIDANVYPLILSHLQTGSNEVQIEAAWAMRQVISRRRNNFAQLDYFISIGFISCLCLMMATSEVEILRLVLRTLRGILDFNLPEHLTEVRKYYGELEVPLHRVFQIILCFVFLDAKLIKSLENHQDYDISKYAIHLMDYLE